MKKVMFHCSWVKVFNFRVIEKIKGSGTCSEDRQTLFARFSKQNYYEKIDKNQRKNIKITKSIGKGGNL